MNEMKLDIPDHNGVGITPEQKLVLMAPIPIELLDILPTGEVYLSGVHYRRILNSAFGQGGWYLRPLATHTVPEKKTIGVHYALYVNGKFISEAWGEADYTYNSMFTAFEAAKTNALMRNCKDLGIASECWDKTFTEKFKSECCEYADGKWRRKATLPDVVMEAIGTGKKLSVQNIQQIADELYNEQPHEPSEDGYTLMEALNEADLSYNHGEYLASLKQLLTAFPEQQRDHLIKAATYFKGQDGKEKFHTVDTFHKLTKPWAKSSYEKLRKYAMEYIDSHGKTASPETEEEIPF